MRLKVLDKLRRARGELREIYETLPKIAERLDAIDPSSLDASRKVEYVKTAPTDQNQVDIFKDLWISQIPGEGLSSGTSDLFKDRRVYWTAEVLGGIKGASVLELGPLEGFHSYILEELGASDVVAVESNVVAFQKCLIVKNMLDMKTKYLLGDFNQYLSEQTRHFDLIFASGILYHMVEPAETIQRLCAASDALFLWTHFYDEAAIKSGDFADFFPKDGHIEHEIDGIKVTHHARLYREASEWRGFCGGADDYANWLSRADLEKLLDHFGFDIVGVTDDRMDHPHGPSVCLVAKKREPAAR
jgi:hypothetical protein